MAQTLELFTSFYYFLTHIFPNIIQFAPIPAQSVAKEITFTDTLLFGEENRNIQIDTNLSDCM